MLPKVYSIFYYLCFVKLFFWTERNENDNFKITENIGNLFSVNENVSLAHCVSADMAMGKGIAKLFKEKFNQVENLKKQSMRFNLNLFG